MLGGQAPGLDHYWREASFGTVNLTGSVVLGWYTLPRPRSYYVYGNPLQLDTQRAASDCTGVADADVHFPSFIGINLMFNDDLDCCAWGGSTYLNLDGQSRTYRMTWLPPWGYESQGPVAHEMGHGFGLPHSSGPYGATYDSRWDVMSDVWGNCPPYDPTYGCVGTHTISYHKDLLGWIPSNRRYVAALGTSQTITLEPLDQLSSSGYMIARIPLPGSSTRFYTVETRRLAGYDAKLPGHAVIIHLVDTDALRSGCASHRSRRQRQPRRCGRHVAARGGLRRFGERDQRRRPQRDVAGLRRDGEQWQQRAGVLYAVHDGDRVGNGDEQSGGHRVLGRHLLRELPERHRRHAHSERRKPDGLGRRLRGHRHLQRDHDRQPGGLRDLLGRRPRHHREPDPRSTTAASR